MATTITERVYDDLTHKLRQWEKLTPAPHEILGAIKSWSALGNADIEAAANAAAGLAVKAVVDFGRVTKLLNAVLRISSVGKLSPAQIQALDKIGMAIRFAQVEARDAGNEKLSRELNQAAYAATLAYTAYANGDAKKGAKQLSLAVQYMRRSLDFAEKSVTPKSVKAFANVPDVPAALAHLRTAHTAIKAQVDAERSAPPRDGGFAGVKATPARSMKAIDAETAAQDMLRLSAKFDAVAQQIQGANGFGAASRLFVNARRLYQSSIAKYGQFWTPDMQRIMKNTLDRVSMGAARDSSDPQSFLYHSMVTAARRVREWADDVRRNAG